MRVGILTVEYPPTIFGGTGTFLENLAMALYEKGIQVVVITGSPDKLPSRAIVGGVEVVRFPREPLLPRHFWFQLRSMDSILRELSRCDVVHAQDCVSFPLLNLYRRKGVRTPWVVTLHTNPLSEFKAIAHRGASLLDYISYIPGFPLWDITDRAIPKAAGQLVAVSESLRDELLRTYKIHETIQVIHNGIKLSDFEELYQDDRKTKPDERVMLFYAGRLYYRKGISHLLRVVSSAAQEFGRDKFHLQIFGRGPLENSLKRYAANYDLRSIVDFRGHVARKVLLDSMRKSDIVCFPSLYEACPMLMMEAMATGKPVLAFDHPFAREILGAQHEELLASDEEEYRSKLLCLMKSRNDRRRLGRDLRARARKFDSATTASLYSEVYERLFR